MPRTLDLTRPAHLLVALGPDLLLSVGAMLLLLWAAWRPESDRHQRAVGAGCIALTVLTLAAVGYYMTRDLVTPEAGVLAVDDFRWVADIVFLLGTLLALATSLEYNTREGIAAPESHVLLLLSTAGMMLLAGARDLMLIFLGIEMMSISVYALSALNRRSARGAEGALKYFLLGAFSTGFLLYGIALIYGATGTTHLPTIGLRAVQFGLGTSALMVLGVALLLVGFAFKVAAAPFHMWAPDVYEGAPTPVTAYMAAAVKAAAFAAFLRVWIEAFPGLFEQWHGVVQWLAAVTMIVGNLIALAQRNIKRLLAYSSIAHAGYVLVAVAIAPSPAATSAFLFYLFAYTLATMGAFAVVVALGSRGESNLSVDDYAGLWTVRPWLALAMSVFMLALLGFPVFGGMGFLAKWYILLVALAQDEVWLAVLVVITSVISAGYYLYVVMAMFMRPRREHAPVPAPVGGLTAAVIAATAVLLLIFGVWPGPAYRLASEGQPSPPRVSTATARPPAVAPAP